MKWFTWLLSAVLILTLLAVGCGHGPGSGKEEPKPAPAKPKPAPALNLRLLSALPSNIEILIAGGTKDDTWMLLVANDQTPAGKTVEYEKAKVNLQGNVTKVGQGKFEAGKTAVPVTYAYTFKGYKPGDKIYFQAVSGTEEQLREAAWRIGRAVSVEDSSGELIEDVQSAVQGRVPVRLVPVWARHTPPVVTSGGAGLLYPERILEEVKEMKW